MKNKVNAVYQISRILAVAWLVLGFKTAGYHLGTFITLIFALFWLISRIYLPPWSSWMRLSGFVSISVWGLLRNIPPYMLIAGVTCALAWWELEEHMTRSALTGEENPFDELHAKWVGIASLTGLVVSEVCLFLRIHLPFEVILLAALLVLFGIYSIFSIFRSRQGNRIE